MKVIFRIDDRLIHGQVLEGWVHNLSLTRVVVASDRVNNDENYKKLLEFIVPQEVKVDVLGIGELSAKISEGYLEEEDTIILFESTGDVLKLLDYGVRIDTVNVGCLHYDGCNRKIIRSVALSEEDIRNFEEINAMGSKLECRSLPQDKEINLMEVLNKMR